MRMAARLAAPSVPTEYSAVVIPASDMGQNPAIPVMLLSRSLTRSPNHGVWASLIRMAANEHAPSVPTVYSAVVMPASECRRGLGFFRYSSMRVVLPVGISVTRNMGERAADLSLDRAAGDN